MRLLLQAMDDPTEEATHAVVDIDVDEILRRRKLLQETQEQDKELVKVCYWDGKLTFFNVDLELVSQELNDEFDDDCNQWIVLSEDVDLAAKEWSLLSTDCEMMVLHDNVVSWQAYPKHGPYGILTTSSLSYAQVLDLKEKADGKREARK